MTSSSLDLFVPEFSRRTVLGTLAALTGTALAGCNTVPASPNTDEPGFASWVPEKHLGRRRGNIDLARPSQLWAHEDRLDDGLVGPDFGGPVALPGPNDLDPESSDDRRTRRNTGIDITSLDWRLTASTGRIVLNHGGPIAGAARTTLTEHDAWTKTTADQGFDVWTREKPSAGSNVVWKAAVGDSTFLHFQPAGGRSASLQDVIDARRGTNRAIARDDGFASLIDALADGHWTTIAPIRPQANPLTMAGDQPVDRGLDGARGSGIHLHVDGDAATLRYVVLYNDATKPNRNGLRTWLTANPGETNIPIETATDTSYTLADRTVTVTASLATRRVRPRHFRFRV